MDTVARCYEGMEHLRNMYWLMAPLLWPLASIAQTTTVWLTVLVTVDRYVAICWPFKSLQHQANSTAKRAVYITAAAAVLYNIPRFFEIVPLWLQDPCSCTYSYNLSFSWLRNNFLYQIIYKTVLHFIFRTVGPLLILVVLNFKLIQTVLQARKTHAQLTQTTNQRNNNYFNPILIAVVSVFIICNTPDLMFRIVFFSKKHDYIMYKWFQTMGSISNMLLTVNSSVNCVIYCLTGRRFRLVLFRILCRQNCPNTKPRDDVRLEMLRV